MLKIRGGSLIRERGFILTLCQRKSRFVVLRTLKTKQAKEVEREVLKGLKKFKVLTIIYDNGTEFWNHEKVNQKLNCRS